jgi:hypothetical protein
MNPKKRGSTHLAIHLHQTRTKASKQTIEIHKRSAQKMCQSNKKQTFEVVSNNTCETRIKLQVHKHNVVVISIIRTIRQLNKSIFNKTGIHNLPLGLIKIRCRK